MNGSSTGGLHGPGPRGTVFLLLTAALVFTTTGVSCADIPFTTSTFRDASMDQISTGVKGIISGIIDGLFAVLEEAGDGGDGGSS